MPVTPVVSLQQGALAIGGRPLLRDIDISIAPGEVVAILGANGSGKSTLLKALLGLLPLSHGSVSWFGEPLQEFGHWERIGYVPQRTSLATSIPASVREVVSSGRLARRRPFVPMRRADREAVDAALAAVEMSDRARQPVGQLSGGQQQRVLMARTLAAAPEVFLLDEPNAGVDLVSQQAIAGTLAGLSAGGATIIVVLHELGPFAPLIQRTIGLRDGRITYDGPPAPLDTDHAHHHRSPAASGPGPDLTGPLEGGAR